MRILTTLARSCGQWAERACKRCRRAALVLPVIPALPVMPAMPSCHAMHAIPFASHAGCHAHGRCLSSNFSASEINEVYAGELEGGRWVLALFNRTPLPQHITAFLAQLSPPLFEVPLATAAPASAQGGHRHWSARDVWADRELGTFDAVGTIRRLVAAHDVALILLDPLPVPTTHRG